MIEGRRRINRLMGHLSAVALVLILAVVFNWSYQLIPLGQDWLNAATIHTLGAIATVLLAKVFDLPTGFFSIAASLKQSSGRLYYLPALIIGVGSFAIVVISKVISSPTSTVIPWTNLAWITWIPLVEEVVFRGAVLRIFSKLVSPIWGVWYGAILFAMLHANPTLVNIVSFKVGLPMGPMVLGLVTGYLAVHSRNIWPAVAFHVVCNSTVAIFSWGDARILGWLHFLYQ